MKNGLILFIIVMFLTPVVGASKLCPKMAAKANANRILHAKELLGESYKKSAVPQSVHLTTVNKFVRKVLHIKLEDYGRKYADKVSKAILTESTNAGMDPLFVLAVIETESQFDPTIIGSHGEIGLMQIKPDTAQWIAERYNIPWKGKKTLSDPAMNVRIGVAYLAFLRHDFDRTAHQYVPAYNMGPGNVRKLASIDVQPREYPLRVMENYSAFYEVLVDKTLWEGRP